MEQLPEFLEAINDGADVVSGDRLYHGAKAMPAFNRLGNHAFAAIASVPDGRARPRPPPGCAPTAARSSRTSDGPRTPASPLNCSSVR